jgi:large subunit ribosomal protein L10
MPTARKEAEVAELADLLQRSKAVIVTDYRGLTVSNLADLRRRLREVDSEYRVAKNTLTTLAARSVGVEGMEATLEGPTALAFAFGDPAAPAKVINEYARTSRILTVRAGLLDKRLITEADVTALATIEPREVLLAKLLGGFNAPIASLVGVLNASISSIAYVLQARINQLGDDAGTTVPVEAPSS